MISIKDVLLSLHPNLSDKDIFFITNSIKIFLMIKICKKCLTFETYRNKFDSKNICSACIAFSERKKLIGSTEKKNS